MPTQHRTMRRSTPLQEFVFLVLFVALFATALTALNAWLLPLHFNKVVVILLASIIVGVVSIFLRFWLFFRKPQAP